MSEKRKSIYEEIKQLTNDNPENYLVSSYAGKLGLRGKFIRDTNGKLIPVLLNIKNPKSPLPNWGIITDTSNGPKKEESKPTWYQRIFQKIDNSLSKL
jgi:hypothetical protein